MNPIADNVQQWLERARKLRATAQGVPHLETKRMMLEVAQGYALLASKAERRAIADLN